MLIEIQTRIKLAGSLCLVEQSTKVLDGLLETWKPKRFAMNSSPSPSSNLLRTRTEYVQWIDDDGLLLLESRDFRDKLTSLGYQQPCSQAARPSTTHSNLMRYSHNS